MLWHLPENRHRAVTFQAFPRGPRRNRPDRAHHAGDPGFLGLLQLGAKSELGLETEKIKALFSSRPNG